jgi:hypothetical protein
MKKVKELNLEMSRWIFSKVLENTIFTIILTAIISSGLVLFIQDLSPKFILYASIGLILLVILYHLLAYERAIKKINLSSENLIAEWRNNEFRTDIPSIASVRNKILYLQFMDIPFTLNVDLPDSYAFEFKAKVLNTCFGWCVNVKIAGTDMHGYLFQYFPDRKNLSPVFLWGYEGSTRISLWVVPDTKDSPIKSVNNLSLRDKEGWYFIRTEVYQYEQPIKMPDLDSEQIKEMVPIIKDKEGNVVEINRAIRNKVVEIKIYDMNDLGRIIYHAFFNEPPFKCFLGGQVGFRNHGLESSLYKDITLKAIH